MHMWSMFQTYQSIKTHNFINYIFNINIVYSIFSRYASNDFKTRMTINLRPMHVFYFYGPCFTAIEQYRAYCCTVATLQLADVDSLYITSDVIRQKLSELSKPAPRFRQISTYQGWWDFWDKSNNRCTGLIHSLMLVHSLIWNKTEVYQSQYF